MKTLQVDSKIEIYNKDNYLLSGGIITKLFNDGGFLYTDYSGICHCSDEWKHQIGSIEIVS